MVHVFIIFHPSPLISFCLGAPVLFFPSNCPGSDAAKCQVYLCSHLGSEGFLLFSWKGAWVKVFTCQAESKDKNTQVSSEPGSGLTVAAAGGAAPCRGPGKCG